MPLCCPCCPCCPCCCCPCCCCLLLPEPALSTDARRREADLSLEIAGLDDRRGHRSLHLHLGYRTAPAPRLHLRLHALEQLGLELERGLVCLLALKQVALGEALRLCSARLGCLNRHVARHERILICRRQARRGVSVAVTCGRRAGGGATHFLYVVGWEGAASASRRF